MVPETPQNNPDEAPGFSGNGGPADLSENSELGLGAESPKPPGYELLHRNDILRIVKMATRPGTPFPIPPELREWAVTEMGLIINSPKRSPRQKAMAVRTLAALERVNQTARAIDEGVPINLTATISPQAIQAGIEAYVRATGNSIYPGANGQGGGPAFARLVGSGGHNGHAPPVPNPGPYSGNGSNHYGTPPGANGNGHPHS